MAHPILLSGYVISSGAGVIIAAANTDSTGNAFDYLTPILSTGVVGVILLMIILRIKIMPTYVYEDAKKEWERERENLQQENVYLKKVVLDANGVYTQQVIPTLTRVLDAERELVEIRRIEQSRRT